MVDVTRSETMLLPRGGGKTDTAITEMRDSLLNGERVLVLGGRTLETLRQRLDDTLRRDARVLHIRNIENMRGCDFDTLILHELSYDDTRTRGQNEIEKALAFAESQFRSWKRTLVVDDLGVIYGGAHLGLLAAYARLSDSIEIRR